MSGDLKSKFILFIIVAIIGAGFLIADAIILIRWIIYYYERTQSDRVLSPGIADEERPPVAAEQAGGLEQVPGPAYDLPGLEVQQELPHPYYGVSSETSDRIQRAVDTELEEHVGLPRRPFARTWSLIDPFIAIQVVLLVGNVLAAIPLVPLILKQGQDAIYSAAGILIQVVATILLNVLFVGVVAFYVHRYGTTLKEIGLRAPTPRQVGLGLALGLALAALAQGGEIGVGYALPHILPKSVLDGLVALTKEVTAGGMFEKIPSLNLKIFFALAGVVAAPIGEEVFFRGFLYNALKRRLNVTAAIVISGLLFGLIHLGPLAVLIIFPMGMALAYVYEKTRSLWVTILMHAVNNGLAFALALLFPHLGEDPAKKRDSFLPPPARPAIRRTTSMTRFHGTVSPVVEYRISHTDDRMLKYRIPYTEFRTCRVRPEAPA